MKSKIFVTIVLLSSGVIYFTVFDTYIGKFLNNYFVTEAKVIEKSTESTTTPTIVEVTEPIGNFNPEKDALFYRFINDDVKLISTKYEDSYTEVILQIDGYRLEYTKYKGIDFKQKASVDISIVTKEGGDVLADTHFLVFTHRVSKRAKTDLVNHIEKTYLK